jgi:uncharacterized DUF497 family protein
MSRFEWDEEKAKANLRKHGVAFEKAHYFQFPTAVEWLDDRSGYGEERIKATGFIGNKLHVLIYTQRGNAIRVISLRMAIRKDIDEYVKAQG